MMKTGKNKITMSLMAMMTVLMFASSGMAVTADQTSVTIQEPESDEKYSVGGLAGDIPYEYDLSLDEGANDSTVDVKLTFTDEDGTEYHKWVNSTDVNSGETVTESGSLQFADYEYPDDETTVDVSLDADATYTDDSDGTTASVSDSVGFQLTGSALMGMILVLGALAMIGGIMNDLL